MRGRGLAVTMAQPIWQGHDHSVRTAKARFGRSDRGLCGAIWQRGGPYTLTRWLSHTAGTTGDGAANAIVSKNPMHTIEHERQALRRRLRRDPLFVIEHLPWLISSIIRVLRNRVAMALSGVHRGRKLQPDWYASADKPFESESSTLNVAERLPRYSRRRTEPPWQHNTDFVDVQDDPEEYLAEQRWGFLLDVLLGGAVDGHAAILRCNEWIARHKDKKDRAWEPYSACERLSNMLVFLAAMPAAERERFITPQLCGFLDESVAWILGHVEYYGPTETNNHVLNNARALVVGGLVTGSEVAFSAGMQTFRRWLPEMVSGGGFLRERSSHYQLVVLNWILDAWWFVNSARSADCDESRFLANYVHRMLAAAMMLCAQRSSLLAVIGDVSPDADPAKSIRRLAVLYADLWIERDAPGDRVTIVDDWFRVVCGGDTIIGNFPSGRMPRKFPTHGHNDATSFVWLHGREEMLVDPGRYRYTLDPVSLRQLGADAHNVPTVNGVAPLCESLKVGDQWKPTPYAEARLDSTRTDAGVALAHNGFGRATPATGHTRTIEIEGDGVRVLDAFDGKGVADVAFHWQFGPGFVSFDPSRSMMCGAIGELRVEVTDLDSPRCGNLCNSEVRKSWMSREYGRLVPILGLCLRLEVRLPARIVTRFALQPVQKLLA